MNRHFLLIIPLIAILLAATFTIIPAYGFGPDDTVSGISIRSYIDRLYQEHGAYAVVKEYPALPINVWNPNENKWIRVGHYGDDEYYKVTIEDKEHWIVYYPPWGGRYLIIQFKIGFDINGDGTYKEPEVRIIYEGRGHQGWLANYTTVIIEVLDPTNFENFYIGNHNVINEFLQDSQGRYYKSFSYGLPADRFSMRHINRLAANYYLKIGETDKAQKLLNLANQYGYIRDIYDPLFEIDQDYPVGDPTLYGTYYFFDKQHVWTDYYCWDELDQQFSDVKDKYPYKSNIHRDPLDLEIWLSAWKCDPNFWSLYSLHILNKYGTRTDVLVSCPPCHIYNHYWYLDYPYKVAYHILKDHVVWDGNGVKGGVADLQSAYTTYRLGTYLGALSKLYKVASEVGDQEVANWAYNRANEVFDVLKQLWIKPDPYNILIPVYGGEQTWAKPHWSGFLTSYVPSGSYVYKPARDGIWVYLGWEDLNPPEYFTHVPTNTEATIVAYMGAYLYTKYIVGEPLP